jgi:hypothetical protein
MSAKSSMSIFLQLGGGAEIAGHDVHGQIHQVDDAGIPLADAGGFGDDQVVSGRLDHIQHLAQGIGEFRYGERRVAMERMKMRGLSMAFMRIRSPSRAPPVFRATDRR